MSDAPPRNRGQQLLLKWQGKRTQVEAAKALGLDKVPYHRLVHGFRKPSAEVAIAIEKAIGITWYDWQAKPRPERRRAKRAA